MLITEQEAKTKWCPAARTAGTVANHSEVANRGLSDDDMNACGCVGSACMWWCWAGPEMGRVRVKGQSRLVPLEILRADAVLEKDEALHYDLEPRLGFCGVAGRAI